MAHIRSRWKAFGLAGLAALAVSSHGVFATDAYKCYQAQEIFVEQARPSVINDAFGGDPDVRVHNAQWFCNPVSVELADGTFIQATAPSNHLTLYPVSNSSPIGKKDIRIQNQFGTQTIGITTARLAALPTWKQGDGAPDGVSPFKCYVATGDALDVDATLEDDFHTESVTVVQPKYFCSPATITTGEESTPAIADEASLTCYKASPGSKPPVQHIFFDSQIGIPDTMRIGSSNFMCVPTTVLTEPQQ
ncbi:MAG: DUF7450 family protein [Candidatus Polarisedimenticolia bacterium]